MKLITTMITSVQLLGSLNAAALNSDKIMLSCHDGATQTVIYLNDDGPGSATSTWGESITLWGNWITESESVIRIHGQGDPHKNLQEESSIGIRLKISPLRAFAQGTYSLRKGHTSLVESQNIECTISN